MATAADTPAQLAKNPAVDVPTDHAVNKT